MKSFKQYLLEDMPMEVSHVTKEFPYSKKVMARGGEFSRTKQIGKIGPYEVHHDTDDDVVRVQHGGLSVGYFPLGRPHSRGSLRTIDTPRIHPQHRGKRAKVKNLVPKVYGMIADKIGPVVSGDEQSKGGRSIWSRLSKIRQVKVVASPEWSHRVKSAEIYTHPNHPNFRMSGGDFDNYVSLHYDVSMNGWKSAFPLAKRVFKKSGMHSTQLDKIKKAEDLPHPKEFKTQKIPLKSLKQYNPDKHDYFVYGNDRIGLMLSGSGKKKKRKKIQ